MYATDMALISKIIGLRRMLARLTDYCEEEKLKIDCNKTEVVIFSISNIKHRWFN